MIDLDDEQKPADTKAGDRSVASGVVGFKANSPALLPESPTLGSLTSRYDPEQHATYLRHLGEAIAEPRNRNIALTGRYGAGKSSVLDKFESENKGKCLRIAISTLGPSLEGADLTNRIQKELVKQLLYRASPRKLRFSRFNRIIPLSWSRAVVQSVVAVGAVGAILAFLMWIPPVAGTGPHHHWLVRATSWLAVALLVTLVFTVLQRVVYGRFVVSNVSAAGAAVTLTQSNSTYFDEYLEEIVYFFDEISPDVVVFEDLDRFDDPHIFEALLELNTLLNQTAKRRKNGNSLRFVYAIKDSLFEQLGSDMNKTGADAASAETVRSNRTKFFDVIIPVVPFISHRNSRELLAGLLNDRGLAGIDRSLVTLVAQYSADMRLLINICNEYTVFAERLLVSDKTPPGLTASNLFALVVYKNYHLKDFEDISRRSSDLDTLYERSRELVRSAIGNREERKRELLNNPLRYRTMEKVAQLLGDRMIAIGKCLKASVGNASPLRLSFRVSSVLEPFAEDQVTSYQFWAEIADTSEVTISAVNQFGSWQEVGKLDSSQIRVIFPEVEEASQWAEIDGTKNRAAIALIDDEIAFLRGADFKDLAGEPRFTVSADGGDFTFAELIDLTLKSQLARDLVKKGYMDRNFTLYAAQFYGDFTGVDVANYIVQNVQANVMDIHYTFSGSAAIANLLAEVPEDFSLTVSAYNIEILDYLLGESDSRADNIASSVVSNFSDDAQEFLRSYFNSGVERERFAALLSKLPWLRLFTYLVQDSGIPDHVRPSLVDTALVEFTQDVRYALGPELGDFISANYQTMEVFTRLQSDPVVDKVVALIKDVGVVFPKLSGLSRGFRERVVKDGLYVLTADNLREAIGADGDISLDRVREHADVYDRCMQEPSLYLTIVASDADTPYSVLTQETLISVLNTVAETWEVDNIRMLLSMAAPQSSLDRLDEVPSLCWPYLASYRLFHSTARNLRDYFDAIGSLDHDIADLLTSAGSIDGNGLDIDALMSVATVLLRAADTLPPSRRVDLVKSLGLDQHLLISDIEPEAGDLLALLLEADLIEDADGSFARFRGTGWRTIESAIGKSTRFVEFMTPELVGDYGEDFFTSSVVPREALDKFVDNLQQYLPIADAGGLAAAAQYVVLRGKSLPQEQLLQVAAVTRDVTLTMRLMASAVPTSAAPDIVAILTELGEPYSHLATRNRLEFEVPEDESHRKVFENLRRAGVVSDMRKRRGKDVYLVKLPS